MTQSFHVLLPKELKNPNVKESVHPSVNHSSVHSRPDAEAAGSPSAAGRVEERGYVSRGALPLAKEKEIRPLATAARLGLEIRWICEGRKADGRRPLPAERPERWLGGRQAALQAQGVWSPGLRWAVRRGFRRIPGSRARCELPARRPCTALTARHPTQLRTSPARPSSRAPRSPRGGGGERTGGTSRPPPAAQRVPCLTSHDSPARSQEQTEEQTVFK